MRSKGGLGGIARPYADETPGGIPASPAGRCEPPGPALDIDATLAISPGAAE
ncbi:hypothetical protein [Kitasatospora sp. NPDC092286]|uniref:hypothetical protein n=1 Tax=Kitasatospora sp. NPDC092286 TaxID=3364087 RepID=UPI0038016C0C